MKNNIVVRKTPFEGVRSYNRSAFMVEDTDVDETNPFSFSDITGIFKRKETTSSSSNDSGSSSPDNKKSGAGAGIVTGVLGVLGGLAPILPAIGIGSKSRIAETNATAAANTMVYNAQNQSLLTSLQADKEKEKFYIIIGVVVLLIVVVAGVLFTRK